MNKINDIWEKLEKKEVLNYGLMKIRYSENSACDFYLGIKYPENYRMLIIKTPMNIGIKFSFIYDFKGLKFEKVYDNENENYILLNLILIETSFDAVFNTLIKDIIDNIIDVDNIDSLLKTYSNRLTMWQSLFERFNMQGLSPEQQRGLYGELFFLRTFLQFKSDNQNVLNTWVGTSKEIRDFQFNNWALEVKTTIGNNHQMVHISSERQLNTSHLENLFLYHLSLEKAQKSGESLPQLVNAIQELLNSDVISINRFKVKLFDAGYFEHHQEMYTGIGYHVRQDNFFKVEGDFPRIQENELRNGVGDVKYSIIISQCQQYIQSANQVLKTLSI
jgi:hypothetical protein